MPVLASWEFASLSFLANVTPDRSYELAPSCIVPVAQPGASLPPVPRTRQKYVVFDPVRNRAITFFSDGSFNVVITPKNQPPIIFSRQRHTLADVILLCPYANQLKGYGPLAFHIKELEDAGFVSQVEYINIDLSQSDYSFIAGP